MHRLRNVPLLLVAIGVLVVLSTMSHKAKAASITVVAGTDTIAADGNCKLSEAIQNINNQAQTNVDCPAGNGSTDTINLPVGTITLSEDLPTITKSVILQGAGVGQTTLSFAGQYKPIQFNPTTLQTLKVADMKLVAYKDSALYSYRGNLEIDHVEVDGTSAVHNAGPGTFSSAIIAANEESSNDIAVSINEVYIHDITSGASNTYGIYVGGGGDTGDMSISITNTTVANMSSTSTDQGSLGGIALGVGGVNGGPSSGTAVSTVGNVTITNIHSTTTSAIGLAAQTIAAVNNSSVLSARNVTISKVVGVSGQFGSSVGLLTIAGALVEGAQAQAGINAYNTLIADNSSNCNTIDLSPLFATSPGGGVSTINSSGGNLSDDTTCSSYFTNSKDKNNLTSLGTGLGALGSNGGPVPTVPLLANSPAIDAGVSVLGLTTDARGIARPQCVAYDAGAYEYNGSCPVATAASHNVLANTGVKVISSALLLGIIIVSVSYIYTDYRRHKKPLVQEDPNVHYTLLHHMKVVTFPLLKYRFSISLQKQHRGPVRRF